MGVKLGDLIAKKQISFEDLANKRIAIDFSNTIYQFLSSIRQKDGTFLMDSKGNITSHLMGIFTRFTNLMLQDVKLVVVFDGKMPKLKKSTIISREERKKLAEEKLERAKEEEDIELISKYAKQTTRLTDDMLKESKELIKSLGLPVIQAPKESDAQIAFMNEKDDVWACASSDYDCLLHGAPRLITNLTLSQRRKLPSGSTVKIYPEMIELKQALKHLDINNDQLIALSILVGTDYNKGIRGIGPKTALKLVQQHKDFNELFKEVKADFNWKRVFAIFKSMPVMKNYQLKWEKPNVEKVKEILVEKHEFNEERVDKVLEKFNLIKKKESSLSKWI